MPFPLFQLGEVATTEAAGAGKAVTFSAPIDQRDESAVVDISVVVLHHQRAQHRVQPSPSFHVVEAGDHYIELSQAKTHRRMQGEIVTHQWRKQQYSLAGISDDALFEYGRASRAGLLMPPTASLLDYTLLAIHLSVPSTRYEQAGATQD